MSALRQLVITHAGGTRVLELYRVQTRSRAFATTAEALRGAPRRVRVLGDRLENPSALNVSAYVQEASFAASYALAYEIITECESASAVSYHEGVQLVGGIISAGVTPDGLGVRVSLSFAPGSAAFEPLLTADSTVILADSTLVTADATVLL